MTSLGILRVTRKCTAANNVYMQFKFVNYFEGKFKLHIHERCASCEKMIMGYYADCYVLTNNRTKKFVDEFLNLFMPNRKEQADIYEIPQYGKDTDEDDIG